MEEKDFSDNGEVKKEPLDEHFASEDPLNTPKKQIKRTKLFAGDFCNMSFNKSANFENHIMTLHEGKQKEFSMSEEKPKLSYAQLIAEALSNASEGMLVLSEIYKAISSSNPYYRLGN